MQPVKSQIREYIESLVVAVVLALLIILFVAQSFRVEGESMVPTLRDGERLLVDKVTYRFRPPRRGEIIVFPFPADPRRKFIKRVVGLPGDTIEIRDRKLLVNGQPVEEDYIRGPMYQSYGPITVPEGTVFVLGDNRNVSEDSRFRDVGPIALDKIIGRALIVYWPIGEIGLVTAPQSIAQLE